MIVSRKPVKILKLLTLPLKPDINFQVVVFADDSKVLFATYQVNHDDNRTAYFVGAFARGLLSGPGLHRFVQGACFNEPNNIIADAEIAPTPYAAATKTSTSSNTTSISEPVTPSVCCFVVQDTVSEVWWQITSYSSKFNVVNLTSLTTLITKYPNTTSTNYKINIYTTELSTTWTHLIGTNPIKNEMNYGPGPSEVEVTLDHTTLITTGDTVV